MNIRYSAEEKECWVHLYLLGFSSIQISIVRGVKQPSVKGHIKREGLSRTLSEAQAGREPWNRGRTGVQVPWNKGKTGVQVSTRKGKKLSKRGPRTPEDKAKIREGWRKKKESGWRNWGGYGRKPSPNQRHLPAILYLIRYLDESGTHFKLGITKRTLSERFKPGQLISIIHLHHATLGECFDLEQDYLRYCKQMNWRYSSPTTTELILPEAVPHVLVRMKVEL